MRRYWTQAENFVGDEIHFTGDLFHHIFEVCRQDVGSHFEVISPDSKAYLVEVMTRGKKMATAKIIESRKIPELPSPHIHLALAISRFPVMDAVIEKAVELGVHSIQPFYSDYSFLRKEDSISDNKVDRWKKIIISATQQSGRGDLMQLQTALQLKDVLKNINRNSQTKGLFCYEGGAALGASTLSIKEDLKSDQKIRSEIKDLWLFVGSEGGFSKNEVDLFAEHDLRPVSLGPQVLRVETACITLVSVLKYEFDLMR